MDFYFCILFPTEMHESLSPNFSIFVKKLTESEFSIFKLAVSLWDKQ